MSSHGSLDIPHRDGITTGFVQLWAHWGSWSDHVFATHAMRWTTWAALVLR